MKKKRNVSDDDESITDVSSDEFDEDLDSNENHSNLLFAIEKFASTKGSKSTLHPTLNSEESGAYQSQTNHSLSFSSLLNDLTAINGIGAVKDKLSDLDKVKAAPKFVERVVADRIERKQLYENNKAEVSKWQDIIVNNRFASSLDLSSETKPKLRGKSLIRRFEPTTSFEKEINMVIINTNLTEDALEKEEMEALQANNLSLEEIQQRQAELAKVNAYMFYDQMKRHRINKIKSKAYRSIKRKLKRKQDGTGSNIEESENDDMNEKAALDRVKERMDLRHKNTSNWAKMALKHSHTNSSLREAYHESVRMGNELTKRMSEDIGAVEASNDQLFDEESQRPVAEMAAEELVMLFQKEGGNDDPKLSGKYCKLFEMDFMKKAKEQQKERALEQAKEILKEIEMAEEDDEFDENKIDVIAAQNDGSMADSYNTTHQKDLAKREITNSFGANSFQITKTKIIDLPKDGIVDTTTTKLSAKSNPWLQKNEIGAVSDVRVGKFETGQGFENFTFESGKKRRIESDTTHPVPHKLTVTENTTMKGIALTKSSQEELMHTAFAGVNYEEEFLIHKQEQVDQELGLDAKKLKILNDVKSGWGDWAGPGGMEISPKLLKKRDQLSIKIQTENEIKRLERKDANIKNVMISERRVRNTSKYKISEIPHPFTSREEYERSLQMPIGDEWNASHVVNKLTQPEVKTKSGRIIEPIKFKKSSQLSLKRKS